MQDDVGPHVSSRSAARAVARTSSVEAGRPSRGWIVPVFAGAATVTALTWVDTGVLRTSDGSSVQSSRSTIAEQSGLGASVLLKREFADSLNSGGAGPVMVVIEPGTIRVGCRPENCADPSVPGRELTVSRPFALAKHETTVEDYYRFAVATDSSNVILDWQSGAYPMVNISWDDASAFAEWLTLETNRTYRLPSEAEWEYAAFSGQAARPASHVEKVFDRPPSGPQTVGSSNADAFGLYDMDGNLSEWVADCADDPPPPPDCTYRIRRGSSWINPAPNAGAFLRLVSSGELRSLDTGFRVAATID